MSLKKTDNIHVDQIQQQLTLPSASYSQITKNLLAELVWHHDITANVNPNQNFTV